MAFGSDEEINEIQEKVPDVMASSMTLEPAQSQPIGLASESDQNIVPPAPAKPRKKKSRKRKRKRTRMRSLRQILAGDTINEERPVTRELSAGDTSLSTQGRRRRTYPVQVRPPLYLRLRREEYEWYLPDYNENEI